MEVIKTTSLKPDSVSSVNITPEAARSERAIRCTPADNAISACAKPWCTRYAVARSLYKDAKTPLTRSRTAPMPTTFSQVSCCPANEASGNPRRWLMSALHMKEGPAQGSAAVQNAFESAQPMRAVMGYRGSTDGFHCRQRPAPSHDQHPDCPSGAQSVRSDPFVSENPDTRARSLQIRPAPERPPPPTD